MAAWFELRRAKGWPVLVARQAGRVAGYASYGEFQPHAGYRDTMEHSVYVDPSVHRGGIGRMLLTALVERARASGVHVLVGMGLIFWIAYRAGTTKQKAWIPPLPIITAGAYMVFLWAISSHTGFLWVAAPLLAIGAIWLVIRVAGAARVTANEPGEFSEHYFAPVDLVGLYWHLVDLIWIFLFPLLYLIHGKVGS